VLLVQQWLKSYVVCWDIASQIERYLENTVWNTRFGVLTEEALKNTQIKCRIKGDDEIFEVETYFINGLF
jgi:hypothetical protein